LKSRIIYIFVMLTVIIVGISSRVFTERLPTFISIHFGDMLWASMVYFGFRVLLINRSLFVTACISLIFSFLIEFSQLYQADWINVVRSTLLGSLVLGRGFLIVDLTRYFVGISISFFIDSIIERRRRRNI
jgi:hypothetical protein